MKQKRKRCKGCGELFTPYYSTLQIACSPTCALKYSKESKKEVKEKNDKALEKAFIEKNQRQKLAALKKSVTDICHLYIRLRDENKPCISCGIPYKPDFDAGHFYSGGKFSSLKYDEDNINGQCIQCNRMNEGMHESYRLYLVERIGHENLDRLDKAAADYMQTDFHWDRDELIRLRNYYKQKIKTLKS